MAAARAQARRGTLDERPGRRLQGLAPVHDARSRLLILGSFPGQASLAAARYYAHPQNHFWRLLSALWGLPLQQQPYEARLQALRERGLALWDVYASCEREGSLDAAIRAPVLNDLAGLHAQCPQLQAIAHNGGESFRHARRCADLGLPTYRLPSSSAANASWSFERKLAAWSDVFRAAGVL